MRVGTQGDGALRAARFPNCRGICHFNELSGVRHIARLIDDVMCAIGWDNWKAWGFSCRSTGGVVIEGVDFWAAVWGSWFFLRALVCESGRGVSGRGRLAGAIARTGRLHLRHSRPTRSRTNPKMPAE